MSLASSTVAEYTGLLLSVAVLAAGAIASVITRKAVYAVLGLLGVALGVSAIFALYGYTYLAAFNISVYVGAGVTFIAFVIMFFGCYSTRIKHSKARLATALAAATALQSPVLIAASSFRSPARPPSFEEVVSALLSCRICILTVIVALASILVEAIALARVAPREKASRSVARAADST